MSITPMISPNFKETGLDTQVLENMNAVTPSEDLSKALKKEGLVQKDVTVQGKNGTYTRKQWVKASEAASGDQKPVKQQEEPKDSKPAKPTISFEKQDGKNGKQTLANMLSSGTSRVDIMAAAKEQGISWKENDHEGINWMRASMAIQKHMNEGGSAQSQGKMTDEATEQPKQENKQKSSADNSKGKLQVGQTVYCDNFGRGNAKVTVVGLDGNNGKITIKYGKSTYDTPLNSLYRTKEDAENNENPISQETNVSTQPQDTKNNQKETSTGKPKNESVIGKDYTKLTTEDEADSIEGQAHNMIVGYLKADGKKNPSESDVKGAARSLAEQYTRRDLVYGGENKKLSDHFHKLAGVDRNQTLKDIAQETYGKPDTRANAIQELLGKDYRVTPGNTVETTADVGGKYLAEVKISPKFGGKWSAEFVYPDGVSRKETYDSVKSVQEASDKFIKDQKSKK